VRDRERGAVTTIVAIVLGASVLLGMSALVVDSGQLYLEREELQSSADAAATGVAKRCVTAATACDTVPEIDAIARGFANLNARDGHARVTVCGRGPTGLNWALATCGAEPTNLTRCVGAPRPAAPGTFVEVRATTELTDGSTLLPPAFARTFAGQENSAGNSVAACARVATSPGGLPQEMLAPAVTVEVCYHAGYTGNGTAYDTVERPLYLKNGKNGDACNDVPSNGKNGPGNFGWLDHAGNCVGTFNLDTGMYGGDTGNNTEAVCQDLLDAYIDAAAPMPLPLFDAVQGQGSKFQYHLAGFGAFMITGYKFSGKSRASRITGQHLCSGSERCMYGYFVRGSYPIIRTGTGVDYGVTGLGTVRITG
jgi:Flp pilus assembly protein TadG